MSMVKESESVTKTVNVDKRKWLARLGQNGTDRQGERVVVASPQPTCLPVESRHLTSCATIYGTWKSRTIPGQPGQPTARKACNRAGIGSRKKRRLGCNRRDTGFNVTRHESAPTSDRSLIARKFAELFVAEKSK